MDGAGFWDSSTQTWHYLGQCLARDEVWNMCHFTRAGPDPMGPFTPSPYNPVVKSGQLWGYALRPGSCGPLCCCMHVLCCCCRPICAGSGKHCTPGTGSEGTPEIVMKDYEGYFYVTFHGCVSVFPCLCAVGGEWM